MLKNDSGIPQSILYYIERVDHHKRLLLLAQLAFEMQIVNLIIEDNPADEDNLELDQAILTVNDDHFRITNMSNQMTIIGDIPNPHPIPRPSTVPIQEFTLDTDKFKALKAKSRNT